MPKNLKGGYQVIDLRNIDLTLTGELQDITDVEVLEQLATLRNYIEPSHDYVKPLKRKLKPILVSIRDKKSDEEQESSVWANLSLNDDELSFKIEAVVNNNPLKVLQINVVFELVTEEDGSTHYEIDTAKVLLSELVKMGDINVEGITSKGIANTGGLANIGNVTISGDLSASGGVTIGGDLSVTGKINNVENPSVKPIYCHPINIGHKDANHEFMLTMLIFNNDSTPYTFATFNQWLDALQQEIDNVRIMASGYVVINNTIYPVSMLNAQETIRYIIVSPDAVSSISDSFTKVDWEALTPSYFNDGVNKIN